MTFTKGDNFIFVGHYWGSYQQFAKRWEDSCKAAGVPYFAMYKQNQPSYQLAINSKPQFIIDMLRKFKSYKGVVYMDIDMVVKKYPRLFENKYDVDLMCLNWNYDPLVCDNGCVDPFTLETAGGIMYFSQSVQSLNILRLWRDAMVSRVHKYDADDRVFALLFAKHGLLHGTRVQWLPVEYLYIPQYFAHLSLDRSAYVLHGENITQEHIALERTGRNSHDTRIPTTYRVQRSVRDRSKKYSILANSSDAHNMRLKSHGFVLDSMYHIPGGKNTLCRTTGKLILDSSSVTAQDVLSAWSTHRKPCDVVITNKLLLDPDLSADIASNCYSRETKKFTFKSKNFYFFMRKNATTYSLVRHWAASNDTSAEGLMKQINSNASYILHNRIHQVKKVTNI